MTELRPYQQELTEWLLAHPFAVIVPKAHSLGIQPAVSAALQRAKQPLIIAHPAMFLYIRSFDPKSTITTLQAFIRNPNYYQCDAVYLEPPHAGKTVQEAMKILLDRHLERFWVRGDNVRHYDNIASLTTGFARTFFPVDGSLNL